MELSQYTALANNTNHDNESREEAIKRASDPDVFELNHAMTGLLTEVGEFGDVVKRHVNYGAEIDWVNLVEELGDIHWYLAMAMRVVCKHTSVTPEQILEVNLAKLEKRYPDKFTGHNAINRNVDEERNLLEDLSNNHGRDS